MANSASVLPPPVAENARAAFGIPILLGLLTSGLLDFCFPVAGPMKPWQPFFAWIALVPLLGALLNERSAAHPRYLRRAALTGYLTGILWYILNCYWIYQTMFYYGHVPSLGAAGIVVLYSCVLGLYFGAFGLILAFFRRRFSLTAALILAPFLWTALELAAARITSVPWDQLGYSEVGSQWMTQLAPFTGVYGISFALVLANAFLLGTWITHDRAATWIKTSISVLSLILLFFFSRWAPPPPAPTSAYAVLLQPNIDVEAGDNWSGTQWDGQTSWITHQSTQTCTPAYPGMPPVGNHPTTPPPTTGVPGAPARPGWSPTCPQNTPPPGIVLWPEVASWFRSDDPRTQSILRATATTAHAPFIAGMVGEDASGIYNSAVFTNPDGSIAGRYDKIHLVPFGEFVPYRDLFFFARHLTNQVGDFNRGRARNVFTAPSESGPHKFGVFICYESVFADEIRHFALNGAQVLVNLSDDGWYGDTSAPWQHLNMARMRAIENRRWLLRDTNNGITTIIDPYGRVTFSAQRHNLTSLVARYGYRSDLTFYTRHGDVFAWLCCIVCLGAIIFGVARRRTDAHTPSAPAALHS